MASLKPDDPSSRAAERWSRVEALYHAARELDEDQRGAFLDVACASDVALRREVESVLAQPVRDSFLGTGAWMAAMNIDAQLPASLIGHRIGTYELTALLGEGGMGAVYRATDSTLKREVAVKVLPADVAALPARMARFQREAEILAGFNHINIAHVYGLAVSDGITALVMELVEGQDLSARIAARALSVDEALKIAEQIARALEAAHAHGIVHRDLKPGNIRLRADGIVKVLDFGLAKSLAPDSSALSTITAISMPGAIMGTPAYMSPEQARGSETGHETDVWAFGVVLYEMLTGVSPFARPTPTETLAQVLTAPLDESLLPPATPGSVRRLIRRCLERDPARRWRHIGDVCIEIEDARTSEAAHQTTTVATPVPRRSVRLWAGLAVLMAAIALGIGAWLFQPTAPGSPSRVEAPMPENVTLSSVSVSPDGRKLAAVSAQLWLRDLDALEWRRVPGTERASTPFWSPDSRYVGFIVGKDLRRVDTTGGPPETVASFPTDAVVGMGTWNRHGDIVVGSWGGGSGGPLWRVSPAGGVATTATKVDLSKEEFVHAGPTFLPDGNHFLYFRSGPPDVEGMYVGSLDVDAANQSRQRILATNVPATFANDHLIFLRAGTLMAQPFEARRLELQDVPVPVAEDVQITWYTTGMFSVSDDVLVYQTASAPGSFQLTWVDRQGKSLGTVGPPGPEWPVVLSPDGRRAIAKDAPYGFPGDLWMQDLASGQRTRFTFSKDVYSPAVWSPDGARIAYAAGRLGDTIYEKAASGLDDGHVLLKEPGLRHYPTSWSRDGRFLLYHTENAPNTGYDLWALSLGDRQPHLMIGEALNEWAGVFSPDMRWIAYRSLGPAGLFVRPFRVSEETGQPSFGEGKRQIVSLGNWPQWRIDREIVFNTVPGGTAVFAARVSTTGPNFESGLPERLPFPPSIGVAATPQSTPDGQRFLIQVPLDQPAPRRSISLVLNWPALLKE